MLKAVRPWNKQEVKGEQRGEEYGAMGARPYAKGRFISANLHLSESRDHKMTSFLKSPRK